MELSSKKKTRGALPSPPLPGPKGYVHIFFNKTGVVEFQILQVINMCIRSYASEPLIRWSPLCRDAQTFLPCALHIRVMSTEYG